ncbi:MAG: hypothetical protein ABIN25_12475 [Ginsengibacter sp.]
MKNSDEILNELKGISPYLAGLEKVNVYQVPEGYFEKLDGQITNFVIGNSNSEFLFDKTNVQQVPEGYFDSLSTDILAKIKKLYPETVEEEIQNISPLLFSLRKENVFEVPVGYFDSLTTNVLSKNQKLYSETTGVELQNIAPVLLPLRHENVFKVPENYFEEFAGTVLKELQPARAKVIVMKSRNSWFKIAAAAVVTGAIAISSLNIFNHSFNQQDSRGSEALASTAMPSYVEESFQFKTAQEVDAGIARLNDEDIIKYLEKFGNVMDNDLLIKNTDLSELPTQADYLIDENTLNSYLDKIDADSKIN